MALSPRSFVRIRMLCTAPSITLIGPRDHYFPDAQKNHVLPEFNSSTHADMLEINSQLRHLIRTDRLSEARKMFDQMTHRDEISWTSMISGYVNSMDADEALALFSDMWVVPGIDLDPFVLSVALKACGLRFNLNYGESLHAYSVKSGMINSVFVGSALLDMYTKCGKIREGCCIFHDMPVKNVVSWTAIITGLVRSGYSREGLLYFSKMWRSKVACDTFTFAIALKACADSGALSLGREIHTHVVKRRFDQIVCVANSLATMYNKCGKLNYGLCLFENMSKRDVVSWTSIVTNYVQMGQEEKAIDAFLQMTTSGISPNEFTFAAVFSGCAGLSRLSWGEQLHANALRLGLSDSLSVANSLMTMYSKCGRLADASVLFLGMSKRDIISWSTIIGGHCQAGFGEEAFEYFSWMRKDGPKPSDFAFSSMISVCGSMAFLEEGRQVHALIIPVGLDHRPIVRSALINMYSKCGSIGEASKIFEEAVSDDIVSWTAMINGYAEHGLSRQAIDLFEKIPEVGLIPDSVTFIGVLTACSHAGLVDLGFRHFNSVRQKYKITPSREHYGCMIDLLCRAGRLSDAEKMIKDMPCQKDDVIWSTLLRASRVHGDVKCGKLAADKILESNPSCAATHITLANMYAAKGKWREAGDVRKMMKSKGLMKEPGWSWIKVMDKVSAFVAGDHSHPLVEDIYAILKLVGYTGEVDMDCLLTEVGQ